MASIEPLRPSQFPDAVACLLAAPGSGRCADRRPVRAFLDYVEHSAMRWEGLCCEARGSVAGLFVALRLPGSTAIVMVPTPGELGISPEIQRRDTAAGLEQLRKEKLHYAQALLLPEAEGQRGLLMRLGFQQLAPLVYLERDVMYPWVDPPPTDAGTWVPFDAETREGFAATLLATYEESLDCPELAGLRPIDDVIAAHQASGRFAARLWEVLRIEGSDAACLLLAQLPQASAVEVVYMGVVPSFRGHGVGSMLLRRAVQRCREVGARRLTLVVDDRNEPAKRLYEGFALRPVARREALYRRWDVSPSS